MRRHLKVVSFVAGVVGVVLLFYVSYPLVSYEYFARVAYPELLSPLSVQSATSPEIETKPKDYTKASNWFDDGKGQGYFETSKISHYTISIPSLGIEKAITSIGGEDLEESLIQYPGTAAPGRAGNAVIFGHSILPVFYDPKNYLAIFSTLPTIKTGAEIIINFDGIEYVYVVEEKFEVKPTDIQILQQDNSDSHLTLVTCTPPGDPRRPKRLIVRARIVENI